MTHGDTLLALHDRRRILVLPNAWDAVSARLFEAAGFPAIATTSAGVAWTLGFADGQIVPRDAMLAAVARIAQTVRVPVTADLEAAYGRTPEAAAETARLAIEAGAAGMNLEDDEGDGLVDLDRQLEKIAAIKSAARSARVTFVLNARTDVFLHGTLPMPAAFDEAARRLSAYRGAGADCVFAPGVAEAATIGRLVEVLDAPLNVLAGVATPPARVLQQLGVARVSIGSSGHRATAAVVDRIARELRDEGTFDFAAAGMSYDALNALMRRER